MLARMVESVLRVPLLAKVAGANLLIVLAVLVAVSVERGGHAPRSVVPILGVALGASLVVNFVLVYVALRPLGALEETAVRLARGDTDARVAPSILADRDMARVGVMLNALLDRLTEDRERVRRLAAQVISAQDEERARVARELHDSTAQTLTAVMLQIGAATHESVTPTMDARLATLRELAAAALEEVRTLSHTMHPRVLDDLGLAAALEWLARQTQEQVSFDVDVKTQDLGNAIAPAMASALYRVAQEALRNAARHAEAAHVTITLARRDGNAALDIADDGAGFDVVSAQERRPGMGLFSMRERIALVNGRLSVSSAPGRGTRVTAVVPLGVSSEARKQG